MTDGIVPASLFVCSIVATRSIRPRNPEIQFLLVIDLPLNLHSHCTHGHHDGTISGNAAREINRFAAGGLCGDQDCIGTAAVGLVQGELLKLCTRCAHCIGTEAPSKPRTIGINVHAEYTATCRLKI